MRHRSSYAWGGMSGCRTRLCALPISSSRSKPLTSTKAGFA
ncbi:Uncharacterised protein [Bordetella pertussis]|nr:Uncharacterised protein [Bordetella pertussis]